MAEVRGRARVGGKERCRFLPLFAREAEIYRILRQVKGDGERGMGKVLQAA